MMDQYKHREPLGVKVKEHHLRCMDVNADGYVHCCSVCLQKFYSITDAEKIPCRKVA